MQNLTMFSDNKMCLQPVSELPTNEKSIFYFFYLLHFLESVR